MGPSGVARTRTVPGDVVIRRAVAGEGEEIGLLTHRVCEDGGFTDDEYSEALLDGEARIAGGIVVVASANHRLAGSVTAALPGTPYAEIAHDNELDVRMSEMHGAHKLYERRGYTRQPHRDWMVGPFSLLVYRLDLR